MDEFERLARKRFEDIVESKAPTHVKRWAEEMGKEAAFERMIDQPYFSMMWARLRAKAKKKIVRLPKKAS